MFNERWRHAEARNDKNRVRSLTALCRPSHSAPPSLCHFYYISCGVWAHRAIFNQEEEEEEEEKEEEEEGLFKEEEEEEESYSKLTQ